MKGLLALYKGTAVAEGCRAGHGNDRPILRQLSLNRDIVFFGQRLLSHDDPPPFAVKVVHDVLKDPSPDVRFDGWAVDQVRGLGLDDSLDLDGEDPAAVGDPMDRPGAVGGAPERPRDALRGQERLEVLVRNETVHSRQIHGLDLPVIAILLVDGELPLQMIDRIVDTWQLQVGHSGQLGRMAKLVPKRPQILSKRDSCQVDDREDGVQGNNDGIGEEVQTLPKSRLAGRAIVTRLRAEEKKNGCERDQTNSRQASSRVMLSVKKRRNHALGRPELCHDDGSAALCASSGVRNDRESMVQSTPFWTVC
jgi:hypothetical protein